MRQEKSKKEEPKEEPNPLVELVIKYNLGVICSSNSVDPDNAPDPNREEDIRSLYGNAERVRFIVDGRFPWDDVYVADASQLRVILDKMKKAGLFAVDMDPWTEKFCNPVSILFAEREERAKLGGQSVDTIVIAHFSEVNPGYGISNKATYKETLGKI